ncbi:receptor-type tyrosine-protein phosphatase eta [Anarrhichthys ocellatus]|uniref:receptor-type tyrosine-protein phosphatase eta n=1 Tax=Anarrhichthys ocellatus TaxID=433405 RepID=UPI0012ED428F|nr:receptor-type tyrosine-protein phosphatase eta-like [Anarrhichthys ocellatus]XP_031707214.1 receptor-type tyrosine-protein phosphatase eta-like [Anarrhichthys ocellatus]
MGKLYLKEKVFLLISSLVLMCSAAEREYFRHDWRNLTWAEARKHCQVCFKELVTVTPENIKTISQNLTSDSWVGLRKNFSTDNSIMSWSRWADGEPLIFQNWYPGWPVFKSSSAKTFCSCNCPETTTSFIGFTESTSTAVPTMPVMSECVRSPVLSSDDPETTTNYIEDSCVAMLSFGAWVEKNCTELLPFICYEDRFCGQATVTNTTSGSAILTWLPGPGDIDLYRVEVTVDRELKQFQTKNLTYDLVNLAAGTHCSIQVFPVKCGRDLDPQETAFYIIPNKVENLNVTNVTETSVYLSWNKPAGNVTFYLIVVQGGEQIQSNTAGKEVDSLTPGNLYTFTVLSGVGDGSTLSEGTNVTTYTKPGKVSDLKVSQNTINSLQLNWQRPEGNATGFRVMAMNDSNLTVFDKNVDQTEVKVTPLPMGTKITLSVTALTANNTLEGDKVTAVDYTAPGRITNLILETTFHSLTATWMSSAGTALSFIVKLHLDGELVKTIQNLTEPRKSFDGLKAAANYTVIVSTFSGHVEGAPVGSSNFTRLLPPTDAKRISSDKRQITFEWTTAENRAKVSYSVRINASFWGHDYSAVVDDKTSYTFDNLTSGTKYTFEVRSEAHGQSSTPAVVSHCTDAEKREVSLSMLCSSTESLFCDKDTTRDTVFEQLREHFNELLGDNIFWKLEKLEGTQEA